MGARTILFIRTDRLGETVLNLPAVAALDAAWPDATITLLVHPELGELVARARGVDRVLTYPAGPGPWWVQALRLRALLAPHRFDVAVVSNPTKALHVGVWLAGIPRRVGYARKWGGRLLTDRLEDRKALGQRHEVEYNLELIQALGVPPGMPAPVFPRFDREQEEVLRLLERRGLRRDQPFLAVHPWTSNPAKQWPVDRFAALTEILDDRLGLQVAIIGGPEERAQASRLPQHAGAIADLVGELTLIQSAALLQRARLLISNDSGPVHLAAAVGTKTLVLFDTSHPGASARRWRPWGEGHTVIEQPSLETIPVEQVVAAVERCVHA